MSDIAIGAVRETARARRSPRFLILAVIAFAAVGYLVYAATAGSTYYFLTIGELVDRGPTAPGEQVRVYGKVVPGTISTEDGGVLRFTAQDNGTGQGSVATSDAKVRIVHDGVVPDIFKEDVEVIVTGRFGADGTLVANELTAKCPSKFEADTTTASSGGR